MAKKSSSGISENLMALLCYVLFPLSVVSGLFFFITEKKSKLVRFHALQAVMFSITWLVLQIIIAGIFLWIPSVMRGLISLIHIAGTVLGVILMVQAHRGKYYLLPVIGKLALDNAQLKKEE
jgi:uncharacterized membrane protein